MRAACRILKLNIYSKMTVQYISKATLFIKKIKEMNFHSFRGLTLFSLLKWGEVITQYEITAIRV